MAGLLVFIFELYRCRFSIAMARPLDFAVPLKKGRPLPLLVDAEEVKSLGLRPTRRDAGCGLYLKRGITYNLARDTRKSR
jgi:hypothetical protein